MADFCKQCSIELFGGDLGNLAKLSNEDDTKQELFCIVLCEGCGPCQVDHTGRCISKDCLKKHGVQQVKIDFDDIEKLTL